MTAGRYAVIGCKLKQNANEGCNGCASFALLVLCFIACFILLVIAPLAKTEERFRRVQQEQETLSRRVLSGGST